MYLARNESPSLPELLTRTADNSAFYSVLTEAVLLKDIGEIAGYSSQPGYRLIRVDQRTNEESANEFEIALVDDTHTSVAYYANVTLLSIPKVSNRLIAQFKIWRSASMRHSAALCEISQIVLFNYILQFHDVLLAEESVGGDGSFNWHRQVSRAIGLGLHVYACDLTTHALRLLPTQSALNDVQDHNWSGTDPKVLQAIISKHSIHGQWARGIQHKIL